MVQHRHESYITDGRGRRFMVVGVHLGDQELADEVNALVREARAAGTPTEFDREITAEDARYAFRTWALPREDENGSYLEWNVGRDQERVTEATTGAIPVTVFEQ